MALIVYSLVIAVAFFNAYGVPFTDEELHVALIYWAYALQSLAVVIMLLLFFGLQNWNSASVLTMLMGVMIAWLLARVFFLIMTLLEMTSCRTSTQCAGNARCDGTFVGPYSGMSGTFVMGFICSSVMGVTEVLVFYFLYKTRRTRPRYPPPQQVMEF